MRLFSDIENEDRVKVPTVKTLGKNECRMSNKEFRMTKFKDFVRSRKTLFLSFPRRRESSIFKSLLILWTPVFTGVTTFYEAIKFNDSGFLLRPSLFLVRHSAVRF